MRKETCAVCGKIVYVEDGEAFEWDPGAILCGCSGLFYCEEHKPPCAKDIANIVCKAENNDDDFGDDDEDDDEDYDDEDYGDGEEESADDLGIDMEDENDG